MTEIETKRNIYNNEYVRQKMKSILIGNGMSLMVDDGFRYESLLNKIREESQVSSDLDSIFDKLDSSDFELILGKLDDTISVLEALGKDVLSMEIKQIRNECREALISAVTMVYPQLQNQILPDTVAVNKKITEYGQIFTTNYDVLLYWCCKDESNWDINDLFRFFLILKPRRVSRKSTTFMELCTCFIQGLKP